MRWVPLLFCGVVGGCHSVPVTVRAVAEPDAVRVLFRRPAPGDRSRRATLSADVGTLEEIVRSPDGTAVSVLWRAPQGDLRCRFANGGTATYAADTASVESARVDYVFLEAEGISVTAQLHAACLVVPSLQLAMHIDDVPATVRRAGGDVTIVTKRDSTLTFSIPRDRHGILRQGDHVIRITTDRGSNFLVRIAVDFDGVIAAPAGYIRNWRVGVD